MELTRQSEAAVHTWSIDGCTVLHSPSAEGGRAPGFRARLLIVEDEYFIALQLEKWLTDGGYEICDVVGRADQAVEAAVQGRPDFVIMDIRLAGKRDGISAALEIFNRTGIRSLFASAHTDGDARERAEKASALGWLQKPFDEATFLDAVGRASKDLSESSGS